MKKKILDLLKMAFLPFVAILICYGLKNGIKVFIEIYSALFIVLFLFLLISFVFFRDKRHLKKSVIGTGIAALILSTTLFLTYSDTKYFSIMLGVFATIAILIPLFYKWL